MIKVHYQDDNEELYKICGGEMNTFFEDRYQIKSASSECWSKDQLKEFAPDKDHFMSHLVAMGCFEKYSFNKNADAFMEEDLRKDHPTFVKFGHVFKEHKNRDPKKKIGIIKASAYNEDQGRVELVVHHEKKASAEAYEKAKRGDQVSYSMSTKIAHDICSICSQKSKKVANYCPDLKNNLGKYMPEFKKYAYAINPNNKFFDISDVRNPADRIAHFLEYKFHDMDKAASVDHSNLVISGAEWAEYEGVDIDDTEDLPYHLTGTLNKLASAVKYLEDFRKDMPKGGGEKEAFVRDIVLNQPDEELSKEELTVLRNLKPGSLFREMAKRSAILPFYSLMAYVDGTTVDEAKGREINKVACSMLGDVVKQLVGGNGCSCCDSANLLSASDPFSTAADPGNRGDIVKDVMDKVEDKFSLTLGPVRNRTIKVIVIKSANKKQAAVVDISKVNPTIIKQAKVLADMYTVYRLQAARDIEEVTNNTLDEANYLVMV